MSKDLLKSEFSTELVFFHAICERDLLKGYTNEQVEDLLINYAKKFYEGRSCVDAYSEEKTSFIITYAYQITKGNIQEEWLDEFCNDIYSKIGVSESK